MAKVRNIFIIASLKKALERRALKEDEHSSLVPIGKFVSFLMVNGEKNLIIESIDSKGIRGKRLDEGKFTLDAFVPFAEFKASDIYIKQYHPKATVYYSGLWDYLINEKTGIQYLKIYLGNALSKVGQFFFNRKDLVIKQRLELLRFLVDHNLKEAGKGIGLIDFMTQLHSIRWVLHPKGDLEQHRVSLYLDSLVESKDLQKNGTTYYVLPKAILTLEEYELAERHHNHQIWLQKLMFWLTLILAISAMAQAGIIKIPCLLDLQDILKRSKII